MRPVKVARGGDQKIKFIEGGLCLSGGLLSLDGIFDFLSPAGPRGVISFPFLAIPALSVNPSPPFCCRRCCCCCCCCCCLIPPTPSPNQEIQDSLTPSLHPSLPTYIHTHPLFLPPFYPCQRQQHPPPRFTLLLAFYPLPPLSLSACSFLPGLVLRIRLAAPVLDWG